MEMCFKIRETNIFMTSSIILREWSHNFSRRFRATFTPKPYGSNGSRVPKCVWRNKNILADSRLGYVDPGTQSHESKSQSFSSKQMNSFDTIKTTEFPTAQGC